MDALMQHVQHSLDVGEFGSLAALLDHAELEDPAIFETKKWPHAIHLLSHIYALQLEDARFLYKRLPSKVQSGDAGVRAAFALLQRLWNKQFEAVWPALACPWPAQLQGLVTALRARLQQRALAAVECAYADLEPARLAALMGVSEEEAVQAAKLQGWEVDADDGFILVKPKPAAPVPAPSEEDLKRLTEYVVFLGE